MKTILVNFEGNSKSYSFNIDKDDIKVGDKIEDSLYPGKKLIVKEILTEIFKFGDKTGKLTKEKENDDQFNIRELKDFEINQ